jgi:hypothetical protein
MTTQEIIAEQLSEIYGFSLEQVQDSATLIAAALNSHTIDTVDLSGREARADWQRLRELQQEAQAALESE